MSNHREDNAGFRITPLRIGEYDDELLAPRNGSNSTPVTPTIVVESDLELDEIPDSPTVYTPTTIKNPFRRNSEVTHTINKRGYSSPNLSSSRNRVKPLKRKVCSAFLWTYRPDNLTRMQLGRKDNFIQVSEDVACWWLYRSR
jgi:hypothetical protein